MKNRHKPATTTTTTNKLPKLTEPEDLYNPNILSILLMKKSTLKGIFDKCLPIAKGSEFQVHYRSATFECNKGNAKVYFNIPTVFYNFPQEVTSAHIDYELPEMTASANAVKPLSTHMLRQNNIFEIYHMLTSEFDTVELLEIADNSFHRHPSPFGFSSTDYDKDPKEPGVIYRKANSDNVPQTDSVIFTRNGDPSIVVTETRVVTCNLLQDGGVEGKYVELPTTTYMLDDYHEDSVLRDNLETACKDRTIQIDSDIVEDSYSLIKEISDKILPLINPNIDFIMPENITQAKTYYKSYSNNHTHLATDKDEEDFATQMGYDLSNPADKKEWDEWGSDFMDEGYQY